MRRISDALGGEEERGEAISTESEKRRVLLELDETTFPTDLLVPLLKKMGCEKVRERHRPAGYGKDMAFFQESDLGVVHYAVLAQAGDVSGAASGKGNLATIEAQIDMAFGMPVADVDGRREVSVDRVIVWTTVRISRSAEEQIVAERSDRLRSVWFKNGSASVAFPFYAWLEGSLRGHLGGQLPDSVSPHTSRTRSGVYRAIGHSCALE